MKNRLGRDKTERQKQKTGNKGVIAFVSCLVTCMNELFLVQCKVNLYGDRYGSTYHWIVTDSEESHHLYVSGN